MGILFPFLKVFEMTEPAFPVADVIRLFTTGYFTGV
jgi:hypothetical protein